MTLSLIEREQPESMDENSDSEDDEPDDAFLMMQTEADAQCHGDEETDEENVESVKKRLKLETEKEEENEDEEKEEPKFVSGSETQQAMDILSRFAVPAYMADLVIWRHKLWDKHPPYNEVSLYLRIKNSTQYGS